MKYKFTENGNIAVQDGKPVVIDDDGTESTVDALGANANLKVKDTEIATLRNEAKSKREELQAAKAKLDKIGDANLDDVLDKANRYGDLESDQQKKFDDYKKSLDDGVAAKDAEIGTLKGELEKHLIDNAILQSPTIDKTIYPPEHFLALYRRHFKLEDGKPVAEVDGSVVYSKENPGTPAGITEAIDHIIENDPNKDKILKGSGMQGSGSPPGKGNQNFRNAENSGRGVDRIKGAIDKGGIPGKNSGLTS